MDLGALVAPQPQLGAPDPGLKAEWDGWLSNPANRAGLLQFGLQLMTPTWGNPMAQAIGSGVEAAAGTESEEYRRAQSEQARSERLGEASARRQEAAELKRMSLEDRRTARETAAADRAEAQKFKQLQAAQAMLLRLQTAESKLSEIDPLSESQSISPENQAKIEKLRQQSQWWQDRLDSLTAEMGGGPAPAVAGAETSGISAAPGAAVGVPPGGQTGKGTSENAPLAAQAQVDQGALDLVSKNREKVDAILLRKDADQALKAAGIPYTAQQLRQARDRVKSEAVKPAVPNVVDLLRGMVGF